MDCNITSQKDTPTYDYGQKFKVTGIFCARVLVHVGFDDRYGSKVLFSSTPSPMTIMTLMPPSSPDRPKGHLVLRSVRAMLSADSSCSDEEAYFSSNLITPLSLKQDSYDTRHSLQISDKLPLNEIVITIIFSRIPLLTLIHLNEKHLIFRWGCQFLHILNNPFCL